MEVPPQLLPFLVLICIFVIIITKSIIENFKKWFFSGPREAEQLKTKPTRSSPPNAGDDFLSAGEEAVLRSSGPWPPSPVHWLGHLPLYSIQNWEKQEVADRWMRRWSLRLGILTTTEPTEPAGVPRNYTRICVRLKDADTWPETPPLQLSSSTADRPPSRGNKYQTPITFPVNVNFRKTSTAQTLQITICQEGSLNP